MIFDSITLKDFGVYGGQQDAIALAPPDADHPIVLFGGMNGAGKTTLLDAVQLVLYGPRARCAGRGRIAYRDYLGAMIHRGADPAEGAAIDLRFRRSVDGEAKYYRVVRSWRDTQRGIDEKLEVFQDLQPDHELADRWDEYIENYIPSGIAHLFFFDAEQIKELADGQHAAEILGTAIHTLLGLDLVDRLETDLIVLERRKRAESKTGEEADRLSRAKEELDRMAQLLASAQAAEDDIRQEIASLAARLEQFEHRFSQEGGDLYQIQGELQAERKRVKEQLVMEESALRELAAGAAPLLRLVQLLEETEAQVRRENEVRKTNILATVVEERDAKIVSELKRKRMPDKLRRAVEALLAEDREQRFAGSDKHCWIYGDEQLATELQHLRLAVLPDLRRQVRTKLENLVELQERLTQLDVRLAQVPREEAIASLDAELRQHRLKLAEREAESAAQAERVRILERHQVEAETAYKNELGAEVECCVSHEHLERVVRHSAKVRDTLGRFRLAVIRKHARRLEKLVLESFTQLLRKNRLVTGLRIDPGTFRVELTGGDGKPLPFDRLSAAERQLLATSILWGLAKASGRPLPTIIDTPLGRLDSSHRRHLLERYFPVASHQVILLSTDEEIDGVNLKQLKPCIGQSYYLHYDDVSRSTNILPGYFSRFETAT